MANAIAPGHHACDGQQKRGRRLTLASGGVGDPLSAGPSESDAPERPAPPRTGSTAGSRPDRTPPSAGADTDLAHGQDHESLASSAESAARTVAPHRGRRLRGPEQSWLELFYDLAFVAAIVVVSTSYSRNYSLGQVGWLVVVFSLIWTTWLMSTLLLTTMRSSSHTVRALLVVQMGLVLLISLAANDFVEDNSEVVGPLFGLVIATFLGLLWAGRRRRHGEHGEVVNSVPRRRWALLIIAMVLFLVTGETSGAISAVAWGGGLLLVWASMHGLTTPQPGHDHHLTHRFGELTIIMLGETFVKVGLVISDEPMESIDLFALPVTFVVITAVWWLYFTSVVRDGISESGWRRYVWVLGHFPLQLLIAALAVGLSKMLLPDSPTYGGKALLMITVPMVGITLSLALLRAVSKAPDARPATAILVGGAAALGVVAFLGWVEPEDKWFLGWTVLLLTAALVAIAALLERTRDRAEAKSRARKRNEEVQ